MYASTLTRCGNYKTGFEIGEPKLAFEGDANFPDEWVQNNAGVSKNILSVILSHKTTCKNAKY